MVFENPAQTKNRRAYSKSISGTDPTHEIKGNHDMPTHTPKRHHLALTWSLAAGLAIAALVLTRNIAPATTEPAVQHAGMVLPQLLAAGMLTVAVSLMTPTVMFYWRRRQYRHILRAERG